MMRVGLISLLLLANSTSVFANCLGDSALSADEVSRFNADPALYIAGKSNADLQAVSERLAATDMSTVANLKKMIPEKSLPQQTAITVGLARAAQVCSTGNPVQARAIQLVAVELPPTLRTAFERTTGQRAVALTGAGAGAGSAGAAGGPTDLSGQTAFNSGSDAPTEWSVANGPTSFPFSGSPGVIDEEDSGNRSSTFVTTLTNPAAVSPTSP